MWRVSVGCVFVGVLIEGFPGGWLVVGDGWLVVGGGCWSFLFFFFL